MTLLSIYSISQSRNVGMPLRKNDDSIRNIVVEEVRMPLPVTLLWKFVSETQSECSVALNQARIVTNN